MSVHLMFAIPQKVIMNPYQETYYIQIVKIRPILITQKSAISPPPHIKHGFIENSVTTCDESSGFWKVRTADFSEIDRGFSEGLCDNCGSAWEHYQERLTGERFFAPPRIKRKICRPCYEEAQLPEAGSFREAMNENFLFYTPTLYRPLSPVFCTGDR